MSLDIERPTYTPVKEIQKPGEIVPGEVVSKDAKRVKIRHQLGHHRLFQSLPVSAADSHKHQYMYHNERWVDIERVGHDFYLKLEPGRRDIVFTLTPDTSATVEMVDQDGHITSTVIIKSGAEGAEFRALGKRNRWLEVAKAAEVWAQGRQSSSDDEVRIVVPKGGFIGHLDLQENSAAETPGLEKDKSLAAVGEYIGKLSVLENQDIWLNDCNLKFFYDYQRQTIDNKRWGQLALGTPRTRRHVDVESLHPTSIRARELIDLKTRMARSAQEKRMALIKKGDEIDLARLTLTLNFIPMTGSIASMVPDRLKAAGFTHVEADLVRTVEFLTYIATRYDWQRQKNMVNVLSSDALRLVADHDKYPKLKSMFNQIKHDRRYMADIIHDEEKVALGKVFLAEINDILSLEKEAAGETISQADVVRATSRFWERIRPKHVWPKGDRPPGRWRSLLNRHPVEQDA